MITDLFNFNCQWTCLFFMSYSVTCRTSLSNISTYIQHCNLINRRIVRATHTQAIDHSLTHIFIWSTIGPWMAGESITWCRWGSWSLIDTHFHMINNWTPNGWRTSHVMSLRLLKRSLIRQTNPHFNMIHYKKMFH